MKTKPRIYISFLLATLFLSNCTKEVFEPSIENFQAKSFISEIKCFETNATYTDDLLPVDTLSEKLPYVSVQPWVVKGKDILMVITVPDDATELYFGATNSNSEYMGLSFSDDYQTIPSGYYKLDLSKLKSGKTETDGFKNFQVVLSSDENIQVDVFDFIVSYKTSEGNSNLTSATLNVKSIAPYQENLKVGFQPLTGYTYSIEISTPSGNTVKYSYNKNSGAEVFDNSRVSDANLTYDSGLGFNWIDFSNPEFGSYSLTAKIEINISGGSQYIYLYLAVITEGKIEQVDLDVDIQQTGQNIAIGSANLGFSYFSDYKKINIKNIIFKNEKMSIFKTIDESYKFIGVFKGTPITFSVLTETPGEEIPNGTIVWSGYTSGYTSEIYIVFTKVGINKINVMDNSGNFITVLINVIEKPSGIGEEEYAITHPLETSKAVFHNLLPNKFIPNWSIRTLEPYIWANATFPGSQHNTKADAARHAYWTCLLYRYTSEVNPLGGAVLYAVELTYQHEVTGNGPCTETIMDLHNNSYGVIIAKNHVHGSDNTCCQQAVLEALNNGRLWYLDDSYGDTANTKEDALLQPTNY